MTTHRQSTAGMPLPLLVDRLARAGGGGLERRHMAALTALARVLPRGSAAGTTTAQQLADSARYSGRWMRDTLAELEGLGVVEWRRGGVAYGAPTPSWIRVDKRSLVALIAQGIDQLAELLATRAADTARRLAGLRPFVRSKRRKPRSAHAEVGAHPTPDGEVTSPAGAGDTVPDWVTMPTCEHGGDARRLASGLARCPACRAAEVALSDRPAMVTA